LFLPSGKGLLDTGLWTADRNRPAELARERPRTTKPMTVAEMRDNAKKGGYELPIQPLDELADDVLAGIKSGVYCISLGGPALSEAHQGGAVIGRHVAVTVGLTHIRGLADDRHCAAGLTALQIGAGSNRAGMDRVAVAGGTESLSSIPMSPKSVPASARSYEP